MEEWNALWHEHKKQDSRMPAAPVVDFSNQAVVAVFLGARPNGYYSVKIERADFIEGEIVVQYRETVPFGNAICTYAVTTPAHIITIPKMAGSLNFKTIGFGEQISTPLGTPPSTASEAASE
ncbi:hypothetical protein AYR66_10950 [Noviherbaspirillum denitrificans]|uniref:PrcB C-terminal domain-containing protein n=2 Tax=Noviherbaspirillum denitrificans TaxID=1968433 RepID=A0A254THA9_9BURK|nr:hypothetical protein AYR66_10950 [Noviherbaspirillum denitrificans]